LLNLLAAKVKKVPHRVAIASTCAWDAVPASAVGLPRKNPVDQISCPPKQVPEMVTRCTLNAYAMVKPLEAISWNLLKDLKRGYMPPRFKSELRGQDPVGAAEILGGRSLAIRPLLCH